MGMGGGEHGIHGVGQARVLGVAAGDSLDGGARVDGVRPGSSVPEGVFGLLLGAPHHASRLEGGAFCRERLSVRRVRRLPYRLSGDLLGLGLGFLSGTHPSSLRRYCPGIWLPATPVCA